MMLMQTLIKSQLRRVDLRLVPGQPPTKLTADDAYKGSYVCLIYREIDRLTSDTGIYELWSVQWREGEHK